MGDMVVTPEWLAGHLGESCVCIVDASFYPPALKRNAKTEFEEAHVPGAVFFDVTAIAACSTDFPHMLPSVEKFASDVGGLGISNDDSIVVYDGSGLSYAPRAWWMFNVFGARQVRILEGGFSRWKAEGRPVESGRSSPAPRRFRAQLDQESVAHFSDVQRALLQGSAQIVDARPVNRFRGVEPESLPSVRPGHIPGSRNVPAGSLIKNGRVIDPDAIRKVFTDAGVDLDRPIITTCNSGVAAATLWFALSTIGKAPKSLYDGSWLEWGSRFDLPVEK